MTSPSASSASPGAQAQVLLEVDPAPRTRSASPRRDDPFHILVLGDFEGRAGLGGSGHPAHRGGGGGPPIQVDRDDLDRVVTRFAPGLSLPGGEDELATSLSFQSLDDFHPDGLLAKAEALQPLLRWRRELQGPAGARRVVEEARSLGLEGVAPSAPSAESLSGGSLLDRIVGAQDGRTNTGRQEMGNRDDPDGLSAFLRAVVAPHLVPDRDPDQLRLLADVEAALTRQLRRILHHPGFQALESLWRGVDFLTRRLETGPLLKVHLLQASAEDLAWDHDRVEGSPLFQRLMDQGPPARGEAWGLVVADFPGATGGVELFRSLGALGRSIGAPVVTAADPALLGLSTLAQGEAPATYPAEPTRQEDPHEGWRQLRASPEARWLGVALPRFLLRLPYGVEGDPCEDLPFEEFSTHDAPPHGSYLWGNPGFLCALAVGRTFAEGGWERLPGGGRQISGLPLDVRKVEGEAKAKPCGEVLLGEDGARFLTDLGVMPVVSREERDAVQLPWLGSPALPPVPLSGPWGRL